MVRQLKILKNHREILLSLVNNLNQQQLCVIPNGFTNNIIWNLGHILVTQQLLSYGLSNRPFTIDKELIDKYRKGTKPFTDVSSEEIKKIKSLFIQTINIFEKEYQAKKFDNFTQYQTSMGLVLNSIEDSIPFIAYHEGIHFGIILSLKKQLNIGDKE